MNFKLRGPSSFGRTFSFYGKWLFSFIWPLHVDSFEDANGSKVSLEFQYGRLVVNTKEANYSYGSLQIAFADYFNEEPYDWSKAESILILGFGVGSIAETLRKDHGVATEIAGVEISDEILKWYAEYFIDVKVDVHCGDAFQFVSQNTEKYDVIIVDLFDGLTVPEVFRSKIFLEMLKAKLSEGGVMSYNFVVDQKEHQEQYNELLIALSKIFKEVKAYPQMEINRIISCK